MSGKLTFNAGRLTELAVEWERRLAQGTVARPLYDKETGAGFWLVGDQGVYFMPNWPLANDEKAAVVYANECDPDKGDDWYDVKRAVFGGDDGVDFVALKEIAEMCRDAEQLVVHFTKNSMRIEPKRKKGKETAMTKDAKTNGNAKAAADEVMKAAAEVFGPEPDPLPPLSNVPSTPNDRKPVKAKKAKAKVEHVPGKADTFKVTTPKAKGKPAKAGKAKAAPKAPKATATATTGHGSKRDHLIAMLKRKNGVSLRELQEWNPLSGKTPYATYSAQISLLSREFKIERVGDGKGPDIRKRIVG